MRQKICNIQRQIICIYKYAKKNERLLMEEQEEKNWFQVFPLCVAVSNDRTEQRKKRENRMKDNQSRRPNSFFSLFSFFLFLLLYVS